MSVIKTRNWMRGKCAPLLFADRSPQAVAPEFLNFWLTAEDIENA
jgi:hypothetical protein